jgi:hypothetical protein
MSEEDLERYESEIELALVQEYRAVLPLFSYVVETERRFYLANTVDVTFRSDTSPACVEVELSDAWVWDMYRPARFVPSVRILTFRDVNIERLPEKDLCPRGRRGALNETVDPPVRVAPMAELVGPSEPTVSGSPHSGTRNTATRSSIAIGAGGRVKST